MAGSGRAFYFQVENNNKHLSVIVSFRLKYFYLNVYCDG